MTLFTGHNSRKYRNLPRTVPTFFPPLIFSPASPYPLTDSRHMRKLSFPPPPPVEQAIQQMPPNRDPALDFARGGSLAVVVFGHFLMAVVYWGPDNTPYLGNTLSSGTILPYLTWIMQIMPLFFLAGGAVDAQSWSTHTKTGGDYAEWMWGRVRRLLRPVLIYLVTMSAVSALVTVMFPRQDTGPLLVVVTQILWFIGAHIPAVALTPLTLRLYRKAPYASLAVMVAAAIMIDAGRFHVSGALGLLNFVLVWTIIHQLGYFYRDRRPTVRVAVAGAVICIVLNVFLTGVLEWFPTSMVGLPTEPISNMAPPSTAMLIHGFFLFFLFVAVHKPLVKFLEKTRVRFATTWVNLTAMTIYLWHMPTLILLLAGAHLLGWIRPTRYDHVVVAGKPVDLLVPDGPEYWWKTLLFAVVFATAVYWVVRLLWPLEHMTLRGWDTPAAPRRPVPARIRTLCVGIGVFGLSASILALAATGYTGFPFRVINYSGVPLNAAVAIVVFIGSAYLIRATRTQPPVSPDSVEGESGV